MRAKPRNVRGSRYYWVPYAQALKVFAYIDLDFKEAITRIKNWGFYVPDKDYELSLMTEDNFWPTTYDLMENMYDIMNHKAKEVNCSFQFSISQIDQFGLSPLYEWLAAKEDTAFTYEMNLMQDMINDIRSPSMRQAICTLIYQKRSPEDIFRILDNDSRAPYIKWNVDQIKYFAKFFWDLQGMRQNNWYRYSNMEKIDGGDRHIGYLTPMIQGCAKKDITWHGGSFDGYDDLELINLVLAKQAEHVGNANKEFNLRASNSLMRSLEAKQRIIADIKASNIISDKGPLEDVELLVKEEGDKQHSKVFAHVEEMDGEVSDPRDIEFDKDDYLEQK